MRKELCPRRGSNCINVLKRMNRLNPDPRVVRLITKAVSLRKRIRKWEAADRRPPVCGDCGARGSVTTTMVIDPMVIGDGITSPRETIPVKVPLHTCSKCGAQYYGAGSEDVRDSAALVYNARHLGK